MSSKKTLALSLFIVFATTLTLLSACKRRAQTSPVDPATRSTLTLTPTPTITPDLTQTFLGYSKTVTKTVTATITGSVTKTYTPTWTSTATPSPTDTPTDTPTVTNTPCVPGGLPIVDDFEDGNLNSLQCEPWTEFDDGAGGTTISSFVNANNGAGGTFKNIEILGTLGANATNGGFAYAGALATLPGPGPSAITYKKIRFYLKGSVPDWDYEDFWLFVFMDDGDAYNIYFVDDCFASNTIVPLAGSAWTQVTVDLESAALNPWGSGCVDPSFVGESANYAGIYIMALSYDFSQSLSGAFSVEIDEVEFLP